MSQDFQISVSSLPGDQDDDLPGRGWGSLLALAMVLTVAAVSAGLLVGA